MKKAPEKLDLEERIGKYDVALGVELEAIEVAHVEDDSVWGDALASHGMPKNK